MFLDGIRLLGSFDSDSQRFLSLIEAKGSVNAALLQSTSGLGDNSGYLFDIAKILDITLTKLTVLYIQLIGEENTHHHVFWNSMIQLVESRRSIMYLCKYSSLRKSVCSQCSNIEVTDEVTRQTEYTINQIRVDEAFMYILVAYQLATHLYSTLSNGDSRAFVGYICARLEEYIELAKICHANIMEILKGG